MRKKLKQFFQPTEIAVKKALGIKKLKKDSFSMNKVL